MSCPTTPSLPSAMLSLQCSRMTSAVIARVSAAVRKVPSVRDWRMTVWTALVLAPLLAIMVLGSETMKWQPVFDTATLRLALIALVLPALGEEILFRAALLPMPMEGKPMPPKALLLATLLFVLWHPLQALVFGGVRGEIFLDPFFLGAVAALGLACGQLYWRTRSIWPPVVLHWLVVVGWKALAGGPPLV